MNELSTTIETNKGKEIHLFLNVNNNSFIDPVLFYSIVFCALFFALSFWVRSLEKKINDITLKYNLLKEKQLNCEENFTTNDESETENIKKEETEKECCENDCSVCLLSEKCENKK